MARFALLLSAFIASCCTPALAESPWQPLGFGTIGSNDAFGDGDDRWRSAALTASLLFGVEGTGRAPARLGELVELRFSAAVITPEDLNNPAADDRAYAVSTSLGLHTYFSEGAVEGRLGADLVLIGPQTGLDDLQTFIHRRIEGQVDPGPAQATQIGNTARLAVSGEISRTWHLGTRSRLRPFAEARMGDENIARLGADLIVGGFGSDSAILRDTTTGQLYLAQKGGPGGLSFLAGLDIAHVGESVYFPEDRGATLDSTRGRARLGLHYQTDRFTLQYGLTYLSPEFDEQDEGQLLGSASVRFGF